MAETSQPSSSENPSASPAPERKGVLAFLNTLKKQPEAASNEASAPPSAQATGIGKTGPLYRHFKEFHFSTQQNTWLRASLVAHVALVLLILLGGYMAFNRPTYIQIGAPTLPEAASEFFKLEAEEVNYDHLAFFTINVLEQLNKLDADGNPYLTLLQGLINPTIIEKANRRYTNNRESIRNQKLIQNLIIEQVYPPVSNKEDGSMAVFVKGYFAIMLADANGDPINRSTPYRGRAVILYSPVSKLNPFPFYMDGVKEVFGEEACKSWDEENKKFFVK